MQALCICTGRTPRGCAAPASGQASGHDDAVRPSRTQTQPLTQMTQAARNIKTTTANMSLWRGFSSESVGMGSSCKAATGHEPRAATVLNVPIFAQA